MIHEALDDMEKGDVISVKDTGSYFIKSCRPKKSQDLNDKETSFQTVLLDHEEQFEPAFITDNISNEEDQFTDTRNDSFINFLDTVGIPIKNQSDTMPFSPPRLNADTKKDQTVDSTTSSFFNVITSWLKTTLGCTRLLLQNDQTTPYLQRN